MSQPDPITWSEPLWAYWPRRRADMRAAGILSPWVWLRIALYSLAGAVVVHFALRSLAPNQPPPPLGRHITIFLGIPCLFALQFGLKSFQAPDITVTHDQIRTHRGQRTKVLLREHVQAITLDSTDPLRVLLILEYAQPERSPATTVFGIAPKVDLLHLAEILGNYPLTTRFPPAGHQR